MMKRTLRRAREDRVRKENSLNGAANAQPNTVPDANPDPEADPDPATDDEEEEDLAPEAGGGWRDEVDVPEVADIPEEQAEEDSVVEDGETDEEEPMPRVARVSTLILFWLSLTQSLIRL